MTDYYHDTHSEVCPTCGAETCWETTTWTNWGAYGGYHSDRGGSETTITILGCSHFDELELKFEGGGLGLVP